MKNDDESLDKIAINSITYAEKNSSKSICSKRSKERRQLANRAKLLASDSRCNEGMMQIVREIRQMNRDIRRKYHIHSQDEKSNQEEESLKSGKSSNSSGKSISRHLAKENRQRINNNNNDEPLDHKGLPLSHPLATTPFPGKSSAAQRARARALLISMGQGMLSKTDSDKSGKNLKKLDSSSSSSKKSTKKSESKTTSSSKKETSKATSKKKSKTAKSSAPSAETCSSSIPFHTEKLELCETCETCTKCNKACKAYQAKGLVVTDEERKMFLKEIKKLRKKIQNPESSRLKAVKSPFDHTQSDSDKDLSAQKKKKKQKK
ncbi:unnamed protein product [Caenorhabditis bovis]|uniref:Uncharacterized protein n=1 Tax=Caenorhabditis bovis TaxID=2654633 RepID=A0A8S1F7N3_9PELO|nr:unnamed protein product [Caenorhabditis bovis]